MNAAKERHGVTGRVCFLWVIINFEEAPAYE